MAQDPNDPLFRPLKLACGALLRNRIVKSAMSDSLGDGAGNPTTAQMRVYERWDQGGVAAAIIGEVQGDPHAAEKPGNLVIGPNADSGKLAELARRGQASGALLWPQLGHAGALADPAIAVPRGPSALDLPGLRCAGLTLDAVQSLPGSFAETARLAQQSGFGGVQIHAAHGFLLGQFLSPLFNARTDGYGGALRNRMRLLLEVVAAVRHAVGPAFPISVKLNSSDQLEGGLTEAESLQVIAALGETKIDLIDISGGTYFPGARAASDQAGSGPYFADFARKARRATAIPLMLTGGFKTAQMARDALASGAADVIGLARALALDPDLPVHWRAHGPDPDFPRFPAPAPSGGMTAWYTLQLDALGREGPQPARDLGAALDSYSARDAARVAIWNKAFPRRTPAQPALFL